MGLGGCAGHAGLGMEHGCRTAAVWAGCWLAWLESRPGFAHLLDALSLPTKGVRLGWPGLACSFCCVLGLLESFC
jgi:hypothetical protein